MKSMLTKEQSLTVLIALTGLMFLAELIVGYTSGSVALVSDAFHMLSDVVGLVVGLYCVSLAKTTHPNYTYGLVRAEIVGGLFNGVLLLGLCISIFIEALQRYFEPVQVRNPVMVLIVATVGFLVNLAGLVLFHEHAHGHSHSHSHAAKGHPVEDVEIALEHPASSRLKIIQTANRTRLSHENLSSSQSLRQLADQQERGQSWAYSANADHQSASSREHSRNVSEVQGNSSDVHEIDQAHHSEHGSLHENSHAHLKPSHEHHSHAHSAQGHDHHSHDHSNGHSHGDLNMQGVFLHVLGDLLASVAVMASMVIIIFCEGEWKYYVDPTVSILITGMIIMSTVPLIRSASTILLQSTPHDMQMGSMRLELLDIDGVCGIHELHVWQLSNTQTVASVHVTLRDHLEYMDIAQQVKATMHVSNV